MYQHIAPTPRSGGTKHNYAKKPDIDDDHHHGDDDDDDDNLEVSESDIDDDDCNDSEVGKLDCYEDDDDHTIGCRGRLLIRFQ